jgi:hypothetical protein
LEHTNHKKIKTDSYKMEENIMNSNEKKSIGDFWPSIVITGGVFGVILFTLGILFGYMQINAEPTGSFFSPLMLSSGLICLVVAFAGGVAVWHFTKEKSPYIKLGQGALVGFLTGLVLVTISIMLNQLWHLFDPDYTQKLIEASTANIEAMELPSEQKEVMIDSTAESMRSQRSIFQQLLYNVPMFGLLNLITGMVAVKVFGKKVESEAF